MTNQTFQKIFKRLAVEQMWNDLRAGISLKDYFESNIRVKEKDLLLSTINTEGKAPNLKSPSKDPASADLENAIALHSYLKNLDETQASDPRLWAYLSHVEFRKYTLARWGIPGSYADLKNDEKPKIINQIIEHWFVSGGNDRDLRRHSIARLWWAAHLTYAPWERDPDYFGDLKKKDPYYYTRVLLFTQDIYQSVLERAMGRSGRILISILDYLDQNKKFSKSRENIRNLVKELNLAYGTKKIIALDRESLMALIKSIAEEIDSSAV
jgi:hypothetical protein